MRSTWWRAAVALLAIVILLTPAPARAQWGKVEGGFGGAALGAMGGSAAGTALVAAAGIANPLLGGAVVATTALAGTYAGAKVGSKAGNTLDANVSKKLIWTAVGAATGGLAGFIFGPGGGMIGKVLGASIGAALGGFAGRHFADEADKDLNPRTAGALIGGINGALLGGPVGAAVGVPLGYIGGDFMEDHVFSNDTFDLSGFKNPKYHSYMPPGPAKDYAGGGYDREGFDRLGYNRQGFDREGYDRFGYDKDGRDRNGYDQKGFTKNAPGVTASKTYDPQVYDTYWSQWGRLGGPWPTFDKSHWDNFPDASKSVAYDRYTAASNTSASSSTSTAAAPSADIVALKQAYMKAIEDFQKLAASGASDADKAAAQQKVKDAEAALAAQCKAEGIQR